MIRYPATEAEITSSVDRCCPGWRAKARRGRETNLAAGRHVEADPIWTEVKPIFMRLQHFKCAYCERCLESHEIGRIEHDVDHFRPKRRAVVWPPKGVSRREFPFETGRAMAGGYHWLAYELANYAVACKVCNSVLKKNYFPIASLRGRVGSRVEELRGERPWLCYPIGDRDADPRDLIRFVGTIAIPASSDPEERARGRVMVELFRLNRREELQKGRAKMIAILGSSLLARDEGRATPADLRVIAYCTCNAVEHASCCADFAESWDADPAQGRLLLEECKILMTRH